MAQGDGACYNEFKKELMNGLIDLSSDSSSHTVKVALVTGYTPSIDNDTGYHSIQSVEEAGAGYSQGGSTLATKTVTKDNTNDLAKFDAADLTYSALDVGTPSHCVMYDSSHPTKCLIAYWELGVASNGGDYTLQWHTDGIITLA